VKVVRAVTRGGSAEHAGVAVGMTLRAVQGHRYRHNAPCFHICSFVHTLCRIGLLSQLIYLQEFRFTKNLWRISPISSPEARHIHT
jgi:hypothetical protein